MLTPTPFGLFFLFVIFFNLHASLKKYLQKIETNKSTAPGDIPAKIIKEFASFICIPMANIINTGLSVSQWPKIYKKKNITQIPKQYPPYQWKCLDLISNLPNLNKIGTSGQLSSRSDWHDVSGQYIHHSFIFFYGKIVCEMVISDRKKNLWIPHNLEIKNI